MKSNPSSTLTLAALTVAGFVMPASAQDAGETKAEGTGSSSHSFTRSSSKGSGHSSSSSSTSTTRTLPDGSTETTVTTVKDGVVNTRVVRISPTGEVTMSEQTSGGGPGKKSSRRGDSDPATPAPAGGWLGLNVGEVSEVVRSQLDIPEGRGVVVNAVAPDSPAKKAGLEANDIVLEMDRQPVEGVEKFREQLRGAKAGQTVDLGFMRRGQKKSASATLQSPPAAAAVAAGNPTSTARSATIVDADGTKKSIEGLDPAVDPFKQLLDDPNVPEQMKKQLRRTQHEFRKVQPPGFPADPTAPPKDSGTI